MSPEIELVIKLLTDIDARVRVLEHKSMFKTAGISAVASVIVAIVAALAGCRVPEPQHPTPAEMQEVRKAVVKVHAVPADHADVWAEESWGTGWFVEPDVVMTAGHVCEPDTLYTVTLHDGTVTGGFATFDSDEDPVDLCRIEVFYTSPYVLKVAKELPEFGEYVYYIGYPVVNLALNEGRAIGLRVYDEDNAGAWDWGREYFFASIPVEGGASGCPLLNERNEVVGVLSMKSNYFHHESAWVPFTYFPATDEQTED